MNNNKIIIITGGIGFIGYHLTKELIKKNFKVIIWDNLSRGKLDFEFKRLLKDKKVKFERKDLKEKIKSKIKNIKYIYHLAGTVGVKNVVKNPLESFLNNILTLKNILEFNKGLKKKPKIILFSTSEIYSPLIKKNKVKFPIHEANDLLIENRIIDRDAYYLSKIFNEKILQLSKLDYLILRPHNIYGPRMGYSHVIPELTKKLYLKKKTLVFSPQHKRAFCYVEDAIKQIIILSMQKKIKNGIFNIGNMKEEIKIIDLASKIKKIINSNSKLVKTRVTEGSPIRRLPDMRYTQRKAKISKFIKIDDGLIKTVKWYVNDLKKKYEK